MRTTRPGKARKTLSLTLSRDVYKRQGLLALMRLHDSRRAARLDAAGDIVLLEDQDRRLWNRAAIDAGLDLLDRALALRQPGPYQIQAAIAALHARAATPAETDLSLIHI